MTEFSNVEVSVHFQRTDSVVQWGQKTDQSEFMRRENEKRIKTMKAQMLSNCQEKQRMGKGIVPGI
jgi:hypothetical protein